MRSWYIQYNFKIGHKVSRFKDNSTLHSLDSFGCNKNKGCIKKRRLENQTVFEPIKQINRFNAEFKEFIFEDIDALEEKEIEEMEATLYNFDLLRQ